MTDTAAGKAVFTGLGVAAPNGLGVDAWWQAVLEGRSGIAELTRFDPTGYPVRLAGEVPGFLPEEHLPNRLLPQTDHMTRLALVAAQEAVDDAGLEPGSGGGYEAGVVTAASAGGFEFGQRELEALWSKGGQFVSAYQSFAWFYAVNTGQISIRHGMRGPSGVLVTEQAGGLDAVMQARRLLRKGARAIVTGGVDSALCPWGWVAHMTNGRLSTSRAADAAYLPFDVRAGGYVPGEGGAILVLEDADSARRRGATVYGELAGGAATFDPDESVPGGAGLRRAAEFALERGRVALEDVDAVFADAAGVPELDRSEAAALRALFGPRGVPVSVPKILTGRLAAGGAPLDLAAALLALRDGVLPAAVGVTEAAPEHGIDLVVGTPRELHLRTVLVLARGHGGFNAAAVVRAG